MLGIIYMYLPDVRIELFFLRRANLIVINEKDRRKHKHQLEIFEWLLYFNILKNIYNFLFSLIILTYFMYVETSKYFVEVH